MNTSRMPISKKIVFINTISKFIILGINLSILVWLQQYLLKRIPADEYALFPVVMSIMGFIPLISIVLTSGLSRYITIAYAKNDDQEIERIVSSMFPILGFTGIFILFIGWIGAWNINMLLPIAPERLFDARLMLGILIFVASVQLPAAAFESGFVVTQKLVFQDLIVLGCQLLNNVLLLVFLFTINTRIIWVVIALSTSELVKLSILIPISRRLCPSLRFRFKNFHWPLLKEITSFGGWNFIAHLVHVIKESFDPLLLSKFATTTDVATFHVGGMPYRQIDKFLAPLFLPIMPVLGALVATNQISRLRNIYYRYNRYSLWLIFLPAVPFFAYSREVIYQYIGEKYIDAHIVAVILLLAMIVHSMTILCPAVAVVTGKVKGLALIETTYILLDICLTVILVIYLKKGAIGSSLATFLALTAIFPLLMIPFSLRLVHGNFNEFFQKVLMPGLSPGVICTLSLIIFKHTISLDSWATIIFWSAFGSIIYCIFLFAFFLKKEDRDELYNLINKVLKKIKSKNI